MPRVQVYWNRLHMRYDSLKSTYLIRMVFVVSCVVLCKYSGLNGQARFMRFGKADQTENKDVNPHISLDFDLNKRNVWIKKMADSLSVRNSESDIEVIEPSIYDLPDLKKVSYRINGGFGIIRCRNEKEIIIGVHSSHEDPMIGDISVAFLENNIIFINTGHVCGNIIHFICLSSSIPEDTEEFLKNFYSDTDQISWQKWQNIPTEK